MLKNLSLLILLSGLFACSVEEKNLSAENLPLELSSLKNLTIHSIESKTNKVMLIKDQTFGDTDEVFFARLNEFTVDDVGRVYIADGGWGSRSLHVYNSDGSYLMKLAGEGRGPGEFLRITNLQYQSGYIFFYDGELQRIKWFSTDTLQLINTTVVDPQNWQEVDAISSKKPLEFYVQSRDSIMIGFSRSPHFGGPEAPIISYYWVDSDMNIISDQITELEGKRFIFDSKERDMGNTRVRLMKHFPFFERHFFILAPEDGFYLVDSKRFLVKKYNEHAEYERGFYYPYESPVVTREQALDIASGPVEDIAEDVELPKTWPAINSIHLDDENRFWISTITESEDYLKWWVLEGSGELLATFTRAGDRINEKSSLDNHIIIKNGYFYAREEIADTGQYEVVRYKIEFKEH